jgi:hypothetical protein
LTCCLHPLRREAIACFIMGDLQLFCLVEGDSTVFEVTVAQHNKIAALKELVREKGIDIARSPVLAKDLVLLKVRALESIVSFRLTFMVLQVEVALNDDSESSLSSLVINEGDKDVQKLMAWKPVSEYWEKQPSSNTLSILVKLPAARELISSPVNVNIADVSIICRLTITSPFLPRLAQLASNPDVIVPCPLFARPASASTFLTAAFPLSPSYTTRCLCHGIIVTLSTVAPGK